MHRLNLETTGKNVRWDRSREIEYNFGPLGKSTTWKKSFSQRNHLKGKPLKKDINTFWNVMELIEGGGFYEALTGINKWKRSAQIKCGEETAFRRVLIGTNIIMINYKPNL